MNENQAPVVSIIIPNFNRGPIITETIKSVIKQTYSAWEAIIVDDGSTDNSVDVIRKFQENDDRIKLVIRPRLPKGAPCCRNIGLEQSAAPYVMFLDSDDLIKETCLERRVLLASANPHLEFLVFSCLLFKERMNDNNIQWNVLLTEENDLDRFLKLDVPWQTAGVLYKKSIFQKFGNWDEGLLSFQDWELAVRMLMQNAIYQKFNIHDCYWRMPTHETIGLEAATRIQHLESHEKLFFRVSARLRDFKLYNSKRKLMVAGLFFWLSGVWLKLGIYRKPYSLFLKAYKLGLMSFTILAEGFVYFAIFRIKYLRKKSRRIIVKLWPAEMIKSFRTFKKVPVND